ncbi:MAG: cytochrome c [Glaciecola sp.]|nr:cytochrome c [Glaciecola sp.]
MWENTADFAQKTKDLTQATQALQAIIANKDTANYGKGIGAVGATCKACHDDYKAD